MLVYISEQGLKVIFCPVFGVDKVCCDYKAYVISLCYYKEMLCSHGTKGKAGEFPSIMRRETKGRAVKEDLEGSLMPPGHCSVPQIQPFMVYGVMLQPIE